MNLKLKITRELRDSWQSRALAGSNDLMWRVVLSVLAFNFPDALLVLLKITYPSFAGLKRPLILGGATVARDGKVMAQVMKDGATEPEWEPIFYSQEQLGYEFRKLADRLKFDDVQRIEMISAVQAWIVADLRIDHMGRKLAS